MRNTIVLVGENNRTNNELYQLLNWRFNVVNYDYEDDITLDKISEQSPKLVVVSMVGNDKYYDGLFEYMMERCADVPVVTISTRAECDRYARFYGNSQFHKLLRPITGTDILSACKAIIRGEEYAEKISSEMACKKHVLVVDDNALVLRNVKALLEGSYSVAVAPSGPHAFLSIGKKKPDLILLDYEMPGLNGKEVMEMLRAETDLCDIPVVFLTSVDSKEIVVELLAMMPAGYMLKPVDSQTLLDRVEAIIGK